MTKNRAFWVVVEGIDGAGKTSAIQTIESFFTENQMSYTSLREPGGSSLGEEIRRIFKSSDLQIDPIAQVLLMYAARVQLLQHIIFPALSNETSVILDRHELSTYAYQAGGAELDISIIDGISKAVMPKQKPDLTIYLSVLPEVSQARLQARGEMDHFDMRSSAFFSRVITTYEQCLLNYPNVVVIDANQSYELVQSEIRLQLNQWLRTYENA